MENSFIDQTISSIRSELDPSSFRYQTLESAARFKEGWADLAQKLTKVLNEELFHEWGYASFEQYCRLEIRIRKTTALKLTGAWKFYQEDAPQLLKPSGKSGEEELSGEPFIPALETVNLLQKARANPLWTEDMYDELKSNAMEESTSMAALRRQFKNFNALVGSDEAKISKPHDAPEKILHQINGLRSMLEQIEDAPESFINYLDEMESFVKRLS